MIEDEFKIRALVETWALARDSGDWDRLLAVWHVGGTMSATWFEGSAVDFVAHSKAAWAKGVNVTHTLGGVMIDVVRDRAVAQTRMMITQRTHLDGQEVDVMCVGRFVDFFSNRNGRWGLDARKLIYENDRIVPVVPESLSPKLDRQILDRFPEGYRHLGYVQTGIGMQVFPELPGRKGPATDALMEKTKSWLSP